MHKRFSILICCVVLIIVGIGFNQALAANPMKRIQGKMLQVKEGAAQIKMDGGDPVPIFQQMKEAQSYLQEGNPREAEEILDVALELIEEIQGDTPEVAEVVDWKRTKPAEYPEIRRSYDRINIRGLTSVRGGIEQGTYDPSIEFDSNGDVGYMAYSIPQTIAVDTYLAKTTDGGKIWEQIGVINDTTEGTVKHQGKTIKGKWKHEVSSLVHDPENEGKEWKLYWHQYFWRKAQGRMFQHGWIATRHAPTPEGPWSEPEPLFHGKATESTVYGIKYDITKFHRDLRAAIACTEPGALVYDNTLYLALSCIMGDASKNRLVLLSSKDHGDTWKYLGTLLDSSIAEQFGRYEGFTAASLSVDNDNQIFLIVSPVQEGKDKYHGLMIFKISDINRAELEKDNNGLPIVRKHILPSLKDHVHSGVGDYDRHNTGGIIMGQVQMSRPKKLHYQLFDTQETP